MRKFVLASVFIFVAVPFLVQPPCGGGVALAISGCCKQLKGGNWVKFNRDFKLCKIKNSREGDDIFQPTGRIWWDTRC